MPSFSFVLTEYCNWHCPYCYFSGLKEPKEPSLKIFEKHLPYIRETIDKLGNLVVNIDIQGGEIGTIPLDIIEYFFDVIGEGHKIAVSTNGLFLPYLERKKIRSHVGIVMWHVWDFSTYNNIWHDCKIKDYETDIPISRGIVHYNIDDMIDFINHNNHIMFDYVEFEYNINYPRDKNTSEYYRLLKELEKLDNITENAKNIIRNRITELTTLRDACRKYNHSILIDLVNENICLCQRQLNVFMPLTEENLIYRLKNFPKDIFKGDCSSCTRLYAGKYSGNVIERALLTRTKLCK